MGKKIFGLLLLSLFISGIPAVHAETIKKIISFSTGDSHLSEIDFERNYFKFERVTLCPWSQGEPLPDAMCRVFTRDTYLIDPEEKHIALIISEPITADAMTPEPVTTEDKWLNIFKYLKGKDENKFYQFETINLSDTYQLTSYYRNHDYGFEHYADVTDIAGNSIGRIEIKSGVLHRAFLLVSDNENSKYIVLDTRSCGVSTCSGRVEIYALTQASN